MSWVRLDDGAPGHRKIVGLSDAAFRLWIVGLTHCNQQANDGRFSAHAARIMFGYLASPELGKVAAAELVTANLWTQTDEGYEVHNYLEYQPSKAERDSANRAAAERMRNMRARRYQTSAPMGKGQDVSEPLRCNSGVTSQELSPKFSLPDPDPSRSRPDPVPEEKNTDTLPKTPAQRDVSPGQGSLALTPPPEATKPKPARKPREPKPADPTPGSVIFASYREAFLQRYGVEPPRDSRTNRHFANVARNASVGRSAACSEPDAIKEACAVAARYVRHPDALYAKQQHPPGLLERDWHKLVTEYRTGRTVTGTHARDSERMESNPILEYAAEVRAMEEAQRRRKAEVVDVEQ